MDVLIDTDTGMGTLGSDPDDGLAIALALASPEVTVRAITCVMGNVPLSHVSGADDGPYLYDSLTVAAALEPELLTLEPAFVHVEPAVGTSVAWLPDRPSAWSRPARRDNALVATDVDVDVFAALFAERVLAQLDRGLLSRPS